MPWPGPPTAPLIRSVELIGGGRTGKWNFDNREYTSQWRVITSEAVIGPIDVLIGTAFTIGSTTYTSFYEYDNYAYLAELSAREEGNARISWIVDGKFTTHMDPVKHIEGVFSRDPEISWTFGSFEEVATKDRDGKAIVNSAKKPPMPAIMRTSRTLCMSYTRNEASFDIATLEDMIDCINSATFLGAAPRTVKLADVSAQQGFERGIPYYRISYKFERRKSGWDIDVIDQGMIDASNNHIMLKGVRVTAPVPLDGSGFPLPEGQDPKFITLKLNRLANFNTLAIV